MQFLMVIFFLFIFASLHFPLKIFKSTIQFIWSTTWLPAMQIVFCAAREFMQPSNAMSIFSLKSSDYWTFWSLHVSAQKVVWGAKCRFCDTFYCGFREKLDRLPSFLMSFFGWLNFFKFIFFKKKILVFLVEISKLVALKK